MNGHEAKTLREIHTDVLVTNARLRAQRDELLAALQAFCAWAEAHRDEKGSPARSGPYREARAAIAKATGVQS